MDELTLEILKSFSSINQSIVVESGSNDICSISPSSSFGARFSGDFKFPTEFCIYDLPQFLAIHAALSMNGKAKVDYNFDDPNILVMTNNARSSVKFAYGQREVINNVTEEVMDDVGQNFDTMIDTHSASCVVFEVTTTEIDKVKQGASILQLPNFGFKGNEDGGMSLVACDPNNGTVNDYVLQLKDEDVKIGGDVSTNFIETTNINNMMLLDGTYDCTMIVKSDAANQLMNGVLRMREQSHDLTYWITMDIKT